MNVLLLINSLSYLGGAQRVMTMMANYWVQEKGREVTVATFDDGTEPPCYALSSGVNHEPLGIARHPSKLVKRVADTTRRTGVLDRSSMAQRMSRLIGRVLIAKRQTSVLREYFAAKGPDGIISFTVEANLVALAAGSERGFPVIVAERNNPTYHPPSAIMRRSRRRAYPKAAAVVCQTQGILDLFGPRLSKKGVVIPNPVMRPNSDEGAPEIVLPDGHLLFAIGSMSAQKIHQKGFDLLVPVFRKLAQRHKDWNLVILGDGSERGALQRKAEEWGLSGRVYLPGNVKNVYPLLGRGDLFALSSRYEGFPNALCEAMACGLPVVSFDCPTGPRDIVRHGVDGLLVSPEDAVELEKGLDILITDQEMRERMSARAREVVDRFSMERVMQMWEELILRCTHGG